MADEFAAEERPLRLVNFVSQSQIECAKKTRGERVEDGTAQRGKPLYEILKEIKDRKDAEFNERFKHRPPKALDEDEMEFLDKWEASKREYEQKVADEDAQQLRNFHEAVAAHASTVHEVKETSSMPRNEEQKPIVKKNQNIRPRMIVSVKPQVKKAKTSTSPEKSFVSERPSNGYQDKKFSVATVSALGSLVSYSDESEDDG